eukprot:c5964_g1_i1.p1 GENE.c5964_g1_i1~~c5964_g1_i1.p1  ORF type:complete len:584 (+),score=144.35 c5964_g1_i1:97-1848(+)
MLRFGQYGQTGSSRALLFASAKRVLLTSHLVRLFSDLPKLQHDTKERPKNNSSTRPIDQYLQSSGSPYAAQTTAEVARAVLVMRLCAIDLLTKNAGRVLSLSRKVFGERITVIGLKHTFFRHFCGGETRESVMVTLDTLAKHRVGSILDYAVEADTAPASETVVESYSGEEKCDSTLEVCLKCIDVASQKPNGFAAVKLTGLGNPDLLLRIAEIITAMRDTFSEMFDTSRGPGKNEGKSAGVYSGILGDSKFANQHHLNRAMNFDEFCDGISRLGLDLGRDTLRTIFDSMDSCKDGRLDFLEWIEYVQPTDTSYRPFFVSKYAPPTSSWSRPQLTEVEMKQMERLMTRLYRLADAARDKKVRLMIDAEHTYFQPAIDHLVLHLQRRYNAAFPTIFNTYQCYLRDSHSRVWIDIERARRENFYFAAKVVRGAYMLQERKRADSLGAESPIHFNKKGTDDNYNAVVELILRRADKFSLMVASHNEQSVLNTVQLMEHYSIPKNGHVFFAQLLGMCNHLTLRLAQAGYEVFKYVPFGPVFEVVPYLIRRAEENSAMMEGAMKERELLQKELASRLLRRSPPPTIQK